MGFLTGKTAIITGAGRAVLEDGSCGSIGYGIATAYAKEGANLVITGRNVKKLEAAKEELERLYGIKVLTVQADVNAGADNEAVVNNVVKQAMDTYGRIDVLINNAQASASGVTLADHTTEQFDLAMYSGLYAAFYYMKACYPYLKETKGSVVNFASGAGLFGNYGQCSYAALFVPIAVQVNMLKREFPFSVLCAILLMILGYFGMILGHIDGIVLLILFVGYIVYMIVSAKKAMNTYQEEEEIKVISMGLSLVYIVGGAIAIKFGGDFVVDSASNIALSLGMSQNLVGLTIVALGTSLPELVTSMVAAKKGEVDMALGNVIGSNIFNILFVLGIAATISPITFIFENIIDILILTIFSLIVLYFGFTKHKIDRKEGIIMLLLYVAYLAYIIIR